MDKSAVSITPEGKFPFKNNNFEKLHPEECEDITGKEREPRPPHRPPDDFSIWKKQVELALAVDELRRAGRTYEEAVALVVDEHHASESTVKRAYSRYIREPEDPNSAENRRKWQKKGA